MKSLALPSILFAGSVAAMTVATVLEEPPAAPTNLRAQPAKMIRCNWTPGGEYLQGIFESTDLITWTLKVTLSNDVTHWQESIPIFTDSHRFFRVATLTNDMQ